MCAPLWAAPAQAATIVLRPTVCHATTPAALPIDAVQNLPFQCSGVPRYDDYRDGWVWLKVRDTNSLKAMPKGWQLLVDQARFDRLTIQIVATDSGVQSFSVTPETIGKNWAPGGVLRFTVTRPGQEIRAIYIGFERLDNLSTMRKISAQAPADANRQDQIWLALMGVFAGAIVSAFAYNLLIHTGQRLVFQRWYLIWSGLALTYGLSWTNVLAFIVPGFAGPLAVSADYLLISALVAAANIFFLALIEDGILPRWLVRSSKALATISVIFGGIVVGRWFGDPGILDKALNLIFVASALCVGCGVVIAIRKRSRVVAFYLTGWTPVLIVFALRVGRNFGLLIQDDTIDMATFSALAFEAVAFSLGSADRFRRLGKERDLAEQSRKVMQAESETFRRAAHTDFLTGLGNRAYFQAMLRKMCDAAEPFTLLLIDVDYLKEVNDRLGHDGGDFILASVGKGLLKAADHGHVSRIGGDEFAILLPGGQASQQSIEQSLEELQGTQLHHAGRSWSLSLSIGLARFPEDAGDADVLVKNADLALYQAKDTGRRRMLRYEPPLRAQIDRQRVFGEEAANSIDRGEFSLHYQPIVDLQTGITGSYEALLRWQHPVHGTMTPAIFGAMLNDRRTGLSVQQHVLDLALTALRDHPEILPRISVNLIAAQLDGPHAATRMLDRIRDEGISPDRLCIEVTEDFVLDRSIDVTAKALGVLHDAGVTVALDDFGTGYASLIHLKLLPFDILKIDKSFTLSLFDDDGQSEEIIRAIVGLGHGLRKQVVAEGVETQAQRKRLVEMGCHLGQGYLFARPVAIGTLVTSLQAPHAA